MKLMKHLTSSVVVSLTMLWADAAPAFAAQSVPLPAAIDYVVEQEVHVMEGGNAAPPQAVPNPLLLTVSAREYLFIPNVITVRTGQLLDITLRNDGKEAHGLVFRSLTHKLDPIPSGQSARLTFTAPQPGRYPFYSQNEKDETKGMTGILVVTP